MEVDWAPIYAYDTLAAETCSKWCPKNPLPYQLKLAPSDVRAIWNDFWQQHQFWWQLHIFRKRHCRLPSSIWRSILTWKILRILDWRRRQSRLNWPGRDGARSHPQIEQNWGDWIYTGGKWICTLHWPGFSCFPHFDPVGAASASHFAWNLCNDMIVIGKTWTFLW